MGTVLCILSCTHSTTAAAIRENRQNPGIIHTSLIRALGRQRRADLKFQASQGCIVRPYLSKIHKIEIKNKILPCFFPALAEKTMTSYATWLSRIFPQSFLPLLWPHWPSCLSYLRTFCPPIAGPQLASFVPSIYHALKLQGFPAFFHFLLTSTWGPFHLCILKP